MTQHRSAPRKSANAGRKAAGQNTGQNAGQNAGKSADKVALPAAILADPAKADPALTDPQVAISAAIAAAESRDRQSLKAGEQQVKTQGGSKTAEAETVADPVTETAAGINETAAKAVAETIETVGHAAADQADSTSEIVETAASISDDVLEAAAETHDAVVEAVADAAVETLDGLHQSGGELGETVVAPVIDAAFAIASAPLRAEVNLFAEVAPVRILQDVSREWAAWAQDRFQRRVEGISEILECRSPLAAIAVQQKFAVEEMEALVATGTRTARIAAASSQADAALQGRSVGLEL